MNMKIPTTVLTITLTIALVTSIALIGSDATAKNKKANGMMRMFCRPGTNPGTTSGHSTSHGADQTG